MSTDYNKIKPTVNADSLIKENTDESEQFTVVAQTTTVKPPIAKRINRFVFGNEGFKGVAAGIVHNVFIPVIKRAVLDTGYSVMQRILYPNGTPHHGQGGYYPPTFTQPGTNPYWRPPTQVTTVSQPPTQVQNYDKRFATSNTMDTLFEIQLFKTKQEAEMVFLNMLDAIERNGRITLGDYLTMCGHRPDSAKWSWGWVDIPTAKVVAHIQGGWYIDLPKPGVL